MTSARIAPEPSTVEPYPGGYEDDHRHKDGRDNHPRITRALQDRQDDPGCKHQGDGDTANPSAQAPDKNTTTSVVTADKADDRQGDEGTLDGSGANENAHQKQDAMVA